MKSSSVSGALWRPTVPETRYTAALSQLGGFLSDSRAPIAPVGLSKASVTFLKGQLGKVALLRSWPQPWLLRSSILLSSAVSLTEHTGVCSMAWGGSSHRCLFVCVCGGGLCTGSSVAGLGVKRIAPLERGVAERLRKGCTTNWIWIAITILAVRLN